MKYFFICGEASGDLHASNCIKELKKRDAKADFAFSGGKNCIEATGKEPVLNIDAMAFMGFVDVVKNAGTIRRNFKIIKQAILNYQPDALVLVDYPGFNLRMAKWAKQKGMNVFYYISPTVWAWKENRVNTIRDFTNKLFVILPFEKAFYAKHQIDVEFVGHPLLDALEQTLVHLPDEETFRTTHGLSKAPIIAVLPGSRQQEVDRMLEIMINVKPLFPDYQFVIACAPNFSVEHYQHLKPKGINTVSNATYALMKYAKAGIIKSGTSTLEAALLKLPQVVCYKSGSVSFAIAKRLVNIQYISLINLIMAKAVVKELVQQELNAPAIANELQKLLNDVAYRQTILNDYELAYSKLGGPGASARLAEGIINLLSNDK